MLLTINLDTVKVQKSFTFAKHFLKIFLEYIGGMINDFARLIADYVAGFAYWAIVVVSHYLLVGVGVCLLSNALKHLPMWTPTVRDYLVDAAKPRNIYITPLSAIPVLVAVGVLFVLIKVLLTN